MDIAEVRTNINIIRLSFLITFTFNYLIRIVDLLQNGTVNDLHLSDR